MKRKYTKRKKVEEIKVEPIKEIIEKVEESIVEPPKEPTITLLYLGNNTLPYTIYGVVCNPTGEFPESIGRDLNSRSPNKWKIKKGK
jgi:hypothetical protein